MAERGQAKGTLWVETGIKGKITDTGPQFTFIILVWPFCCSLSDVLPNASLEVPPKKYRYVSIPPLVILILAIILNMYCLVQSNGFEQPTKKAERLVSGSD